MPNRRWAVPSRTRAHTDTPIHTHTVAYSDGVSSYPSSRWILAIRVWVHGVWDTRCVCRSSRRYTRYRPIGYDGYGTHTGLPTLTHSHIRAHRTRYVLSMHSGVEMRPMARAISSARGTSTVGPPQNRPIGYNEYGTNTGPPMLFRTDIRTFRDRYVLSKRSVVEIRPQMRV